MAYKTLKLLLAFSLVFATGCSSRNTYPFDGLPKSVGTGSYAFDVSNPDLVVAFRDYVVVGRIDEYVGTRYPDSLSDPQGDYRVDIRAPQTDYEVTILEVIKGNLKAGQKVPITKNGGIAKDKSRVILDGEGDFLPEVGGVYIFVVSVYPDRKTLVVYDGYDVIPLESSVVTELNRVEEAKVSNKQALIRNCLKSSDVFVRYVEAAENEDAAAGFPSHIQEYVQNRERFKSVYEK